MFFLRISRCVLWLFAERTRVYKTNCKSYEKSPVIYISRLPSAVWLLHQSTHSSLEKLSYHKSHTGRGIWKSADFYFQLSIHLPEWRKVTSRRKRQKEKGQRKLRLFVKVEQGSCLRFFKAICTETVALNICCCDVIDTYSD